MAPALTLAEPHALVTQELAAHPRRSVFWRKLVSSLSGSLLAGIITPGVVMSVTGAQSVWFFVLLGLEVWALSFALSTVFKSSGTVLAVTFGVLAVLVGGQLGALTLGFRLTSSDVRTVLTAPSVTLASFGLIGPSALIFAWRRMVRIKATPVKDLLVLVICNLLHATSLGAIASIAIERQVMPF